MSKKQLGKEKIVLMSKIFYNVDVQDGGEKIYEAYADSIIDHQDFMEGVKSHIKFIQSLCKAGLEENDVQRLNGISNFCESFLIRNHLKDEIEDNNKTNESGGNNETID